jgi:hypothetical protein
MLNGTDSIGLQEVNDWKLDEGGYELAFYKLLTTVERMADADRDFQLNFDHFKEKIFIMAADLTTSGTISADRLNLIKKGVVTLKVELKSPFKKTYCTLVWFIEPVMMGVAPGDLPTISSTFPDE